MPKKKDMLLIAVVVIAAALMLGVSRMIPRTDLSEKTADVTLAPDAVEYIATPEPTHAPEATQTPEPASAATEAPEATDTAPEVTAEPEAAEPAGQAAMAGPMPPAQASEIRGHVVLTVGGRQYGDPIPMDRDKIITLKQESGAINKVHITPEKVYMESSTCENQDCVGQGEIHVDTYQDRILGTWVICLPNNVTIEMIPEQ